MRVLKLLYELANKLAPSDYECELRFSTINIVIASSDFANLLLIH
jgi:hypothetical protein